MNSSKERRKKKKKKRLMKIFLRTIIITLIVVGAVFGTIWLTYNHFLHEGSGVSDKNNDAPLDTINKTLAVFGVDEDGYRTDVIFVVNYNSETGKVKLVSIPRDTKVEWTSEQQEKMIEYKGYAISTSKINEMTSYGGIEHIRDFTINQIENLLDIEVDNYVIITIDAFKDLVDAVGGVDVVVPELNGNGLHYDDYYQDLHIHLDPGPTHLDGEAAEGFVRFRKGYVDGDVGRIKTQQIFLEAFAKKVMSPEVITKIPNIAKVILTSVKTDIKINEITTYYSYLKQIDTTNLSFNIIPGKGSYEGSKSYYFPDMEAMPQFIREVFYDEAPVEEDVVIEDKTVQMEILNSTDINGLAGKAKEQLEAAGYTVTSVGNYQGTALGITKIYAKDIEKAKQFKTYFENAEIEQSNDITGDIQIILGNDTSY